jgi:hypothetical protein
MLGRHGERWQIKTGRQAVKLAPRFISAGMKLILEAFRRIISA